MKKLGIIQEQIENAKNLATVLDEFDEFLKQNVSYFFDFILECTQ